MSESGRSIIRPRQIGDDPVIYNAICGICGRTAAWNTWDSAEAWLKGHIDRDCAIARFLRGAERPGLTLREALRLAEITPSHDPQVERAAHARAKLAEHARRLKREQGLVHKWRAEARKATLPEQKES